MKYRVTHEYLALFRYMYRHRFTGREPVVDPEWFEAERKAIALLIAHDDHPSEQEFFSMERDVYGVVTYFPFLSQEAQDD